MIEFIIRCVIMCGWLWLAAYAYTVWREGRRRP